MECKPKGTRSQRGRSSHRNTIATDRRTAFKIRFKAIFLPLLKYALAATKITKTGTGENANLGIVQAEDTTTPQEIKATINESNGWNPK